MISNIRKLTEAEKLLMNILWQQERAFMRDIMDSYREQQPAMTTVATLLKRLQHKHFVGYKTYGNSREYYPLVDKNSYILSEIEHLVLTFFDGSSSDFMSFAKENFKY